MSEIKVYIACCKADFYLLKSCVASIRYWNKEVELYLLKDFSGGTFNTSLLEKTFQVSVVNTKYKKLGAYMKLQPFIEGPNETIFLQDADMVWLGDMIDKLKSIDTDLGIQTYMPNDIETELNSWYFNTKLLTQFYPDYKYPGFVFNTGSIFLQPKHFTEKDLQDIIVWKERALPIHEGVFLCEDQGIINYIVAQKYLSKSVDISKIDLQISSESAEAKAYNLREIEKKNPNYMIVHWFGRKIGLNSFCSSNHLLRFYEKQYYRHFKNGNTKMLVDRLMRTIKCFDKFTYEVAKKIYLLIISRK